MQSFPIFQGDTFLADCLYRDAAGVPVSVANIGITAYLKGKDRVDHPILVTKSAEIGQYTLRADTSQWPLGRNTLIVRYTVNDVIRTAPPVTVEVQDV